MPTSSALSLLSTSIFAAALLAGCSEPARERDAPARSAMQPRTGPAGEAGTELLASGDFADGALGWELSGARPQADLGPFDEAAVMLEPADSIALTLPAPAGEPVRFALAVQGLSSGSSVRVAFMPLGAGEAVDDEDFWHDQTFPVEAGTWQRCVWRYDVPSDAERLRIRIEPAGGGRALIARASLMVEDYELDGLEAGEVLRLTRLIVPDVERLRGLLFEKEVPVEVVDDDAARAFFEDRVQKFWPLERQQADEQAYRLLGLWPTEQPLVEAILELLEEQAGGFYDPETERFYVLGDMPTAAAPIIIAHELTHALDDQHHDLDGQIARLVDDTDASAALGAVIEGSGTVIMSKYMGEMIAADRLSLSSVASMQQSEAGKAESLRAAPPYLSRSLIFSYVMGMHFLLRGQGQLAIGDFEPADIDSAFRTPPRSTEQVLHPNGYWVGADEPRPVTLPDLSLLLGAGWTLRRDDTLGEMLLPILTGGGEVDVTSAEITAPSSWTGYRTAGWGGDRWQLYEAPDAARSQRFVALLATLWDTPADAQEFEAGLTLPAGSHVERRGQAVVIVAGAEGLPGVESAALAGAALDAITPR